MRRNFVSRFLMRFAGTLPASGGVASGAGETPPGIQWQVEPLAATILCRARQCGGGMTNHK